MPHMKTSLCLAVAVLGLSTAAFADNFYPNGYYLGGGLSMAKMSLGDFKMTPNSAVLVEQKGGDESSEAGGHLDIGYAMASLPLEFNVSYMYRLPFNYDQSPVFKGRDDSVRSRVSTQALFANAVLDANWNYGRQSMPIIPFLTVGYGLAMNAVDLTVTNHAGLDANNKSQTFNGAWQAGIGTHIRLTPNFLFNIAVYHQNLGKVDFGPWKDKTTKAQYNVTNEALTNNDVRIGLSYVFGDQHIPPSLLGADD